jgi:biopolymer transport protein TolQ
MFSFITGGYLWHLVGGIDWLTRFILLSLFLLSVACIAIIIGKIIEFRAITKNSLKVFERLSKVKESTELSSISVIYRESAPGELVKRIVDGVGASSDSQVLDKVEVDAGFFVEELVSRSEKFLPVLGVSAAVAPLIGLFGTIWGLIHALISMGQAQSADLTVVAPGIAEALFTTLAGLAVAIPALISFQVLSNQLRKIEWRLFSIADTALSIFRYSGE